MLRTLKGWTLLDRTTQQWNGSLRGGNKRTTWRDTQSINTYSKRMKFWWSKKLAELCSKKILTLLQWATRLGFRITIIKAHKGRQCTLEKTQPFIELLISFWIIQWTSHQQDTYLISIQTWVKFLTTTKISSSRASLLVHLSILITNRNQWDLSKCQVMILM
jgi:uncharacterized protein Veg